MRPLPGAVFHILRDGQLIGTEVPDALRTVPNVTEGMYAFVEVSASPLRQADRPLSAPHDQATVNGGGTVTVTAKEFETPLNLTIQSWISRPSSPSPARSLRSRASITAIIRTHHRPDGKAVLTSDPC